MSMNTATHVHAALARAAEKLQPAPLEQVIKEAESELRIGINRTWAADALVANGFEVAELPDQTVSRKPREPEVFT